MADMAVTVMAVTVGAVMAVTVGLVMVGMAVTVGTAVAGGVDGEDGGGQASASLLAPGIATDIIRIAITDMDIPGTVITIGPIDIGTIVIIGIIITATTKTRDQTRPSEDAGRKPRLRESIRPVWASLISVEWPTFPIPANRAWAHHLIPDRGERDGERHSGKTSGD
jgi:hypothetical protein